METRSTRAGVRREDQLDLTTKLAEPPVTSLEERVDAHLDERSTRAKDHDKDMKEADEKREREVQKTHRDAEKAAKDAEEAQKRDKDSRDHQGKGKDEKDERAGLPHTQPTAGAGTADEVIM